MTETLPHLASAMPTTMCMITHRPSVHRLYVRLLSPLLPGVWTVGASGRARSGGPPRHTHTHTHTPRAPVLPMARGSIAQHPSEQEGRQRDRDGHTASLCKLPHVRDRPALPSSTSGKRAGTSPVNAGVHETIVERQVHFPVERLKMDLPFVNVSWVQTSAQRSASPLDAAMAELQKRA